MDSTSIESIKALFSSVIGMTGGGIGSGSFFLPIGIRSFSAVEFLFSLHFKHVGNRLESLLDGLKADFHQKSSGITHFERLPVRMRRQLAGSLQSQDDHNVFFEVVRNLLR